MSNDRIKKVIEEWNETADSDWYMSDRTDEVITSIVNDPSTAFHRTTWEMIKAAFSDLKGKKICVPSSGDNKAVFAFAALGANVVSCDICERQLQHAQRIANKYNLDIEFIVQNTMELTDIKSGEFDFVYTSEGVHVWINDLPSMYKNIFRILKKGGMYINFEIHPFGRPFAYDDEKPMDKKIVIRKTYDETGPFFNGIEHHWRMQDLLNAISSSGLYKSFRGNA
ncbi:MAG: hypothetical protein A2Y17_01855 [Clostridiales bacterium GWF2_38_85]|nr:MAG: hypothetical protein A2Y17_01855 [Clostridiales bacterium GWF2_38_85]HBL84745.1 class I SAM-dependent methyltransferase [Clostridiales bacterium]